MKFIVSMGFAVGKSFKKINDNNYYIIVKPLEVCIFENFEKKVSIGIKRIRNVYI